MTRALALIALALTVAAIARVRRGRREAEDDYAEPVPMTWWPTQTDPDGRQWTYTTGGVTYGFDPARGNSGTYWYNPATGVVVSAN